MEKKIEKRGSAVDDDVNRWSVMNEDDNDKVVDRESKEVIWLLENLNDNTFSTVSI